MNRRIARRLMLAATVVAVLLGRVSADGEFPPRPRPVEAGDCKRFSSAEFERLILQLKTERGELDTSWKSQPGSKSNDRTNADQEHLLLQMQLKQVLERLQQRQRNSLPPLPTTEPRKTDASATAPVTNEEKKTPADPADGKKLDERATKPASGAKSVEPADSLTLAQTLFRAGLYEEALTAFRKIDLKGKRASERAPVLYLTACCLQRLGKSDDALPLLRDVANSRGDERVAEYAQWQLALIRWQQETRDQLQNVRQRRQALEKKL